MMTGTIRFLLTNFPLTFLLASLSCALIKIYRHRINITKAYITEVFIANYFLWCLGISLIYNGIVHITFPDMAANFMNWAKSPYRLEIGFTSMTLGVAFLLTFKQNFRLRLSVVITTSVFLWCCAGSHLYLISKYQTSPDSIYMLWFGLLQPIISFIALIASRSFGKNENLLHFNNSKTFFITIPVSNKIL